MYKSVQIGQAVSGPVQRTLCLKSRKINAQATRSVSVFAKKIERGYFADVDPHEPVYAPMGGIDQQDLTKRGGRWTSDFIWNTRWKDQLDLEESRRKEREANKDKVEIVPGGLSFHRVGDLNSMDVDLSEQLRPKKQPTAAQASSSHAAPGPGPSNAARKHAEQQRILYQRGQQGGAFERVPPSKGESRRWERSGRFQKRATANQSQGLSKGAAPQERAAEERRVYEGLKEDHWRRSVTVTGFFLLATTTQSQDPTEVAARQERLAEERKVYENLKQELWRWSVSVTALCFAGTIALFSRDTSASYGVGALGGLMYLRLLNRSVDSVANSALPVGVAAGGQARFAIPVLLVLLFNRSTAMYHGSAAVHLELLPTLLGFFTYKLLPMLLGFFTYKAGVVGRGAYELLSDAASPSSTSEDAATDVKGAMLQAAVFDAAMPTHKPAAADSVEPSRQPMEALGNTGE